MPRCATSTQKQKSRAGRGGVTIKAMRHSARATRAVRRRRRMMSAAIMRAISIETVVIVKRFAASSNVAPWVTSSARAGPALTGRRQALARSVRSRSARGLMARRLTCRIPFMQCRGKAQTELPHVAEDIVALGHHAPLDSRHQIGKGAFAYLAVEAAVCGKGTRSQYDHPSIGRE